MESSILWWCQHHAWDSTSWRLNAANQWSFEDHGQMKIETQITCIIFESCKLFVKSAKDSQNIPHKKHTNLRDRLVWYTYMHQNRFCTLFFLVAVAYNLCHCNVSIPKDPCMVYLPIIYHKNQPNVGKYAIHGSYGKETPAAKTKNTEGNTAQPPWPLPHPPHDWLCLIRGKDGETYLKITWEDLENGPKFQILHIFKENMYI